MKRKYRLVSRRDFDRVFSTRQARSTPLLVAHLRRVPPDPARAERAEPRLGLAVSRKVGKAHTRNLVKRRLREAWRHLRPGMNPWWDVVVVARPAAASAGLEELVRALRTALRPLSDSAP